MAESNYTPNGNTGNSKKFEEALHLLNEAAKEKKDEIQSLLSNRYTDIQQLIQKKAKEKVETLGRYRESAEEMIGQGADQIKSAASDMDKKMRENPWPYLGGAALAALLLGFIMGNSKDK